MGLWRAASLVVFGLLFLSFIVTVYWDSIYIVSALGTRIILHIFVIASVVAYLLFTERIYRSVNAPNIKTVFIFAVVFAAPALLVRCFELCVMFVRFQQKDIIYYLSSISGIVEFVLWTVALPFSLLMLLHVFTNWMERPLEILCGVAAFCSLMMLVCQVYPEPVILWSLIAIWGAAYIYAVFAYIVKAIGKKGAA